MKISIRQEMPSDYRAVFEVIEKAFATLDFSDHQEQFLVEKLRKSAAFIPELSLVAVAGDQIVGYILLTKINIKNSVKSFNSLALAPMAVLPAFQGKGIGRELIETAHSIAKDSGHNSVVVLGHSDYYPKFGYKQAHQFGITLPFDVPLENCMAIELIENGLAGVSGVVEYPKEFFE